MPTPTPQRAWPRFWKVVGQVLLVWCGALAAALLLAPPGAHADELDPALQERIRLFTVQTMQSQPVMRPGFVSAPSPTQASSPIPAKPAAAPRIHVEVGAIDTRLHLAPCSRAEPYLPSGSRLGGSSRIGLRCLQGATLWNISVPVRIQVFARGLVGLNHVAAGSVISAQDVAMGEIDLLADPTGPLLDTEVLEGRTLARPLALGQSLRQSHLKPRQWFAAGDMVRVVAAGEGFAIAGQAQALTPGVEGQSARVRTESGRVLTGMPVGEREISLGL